MPPLSAYAPGRVELLGNHTDYNQGVVLAAAIDRGVTVTGSARRDDVIALTSTAQQGRVEVKIGEFRPKDTQPWANYSLGVVQELIHAGYRVGGFEAHITSDLPIGAGLSSSAALEVATTCFLIKLRGLQIDALTVAKSCQRAENEFVGVRSGLLDQVTSVFGRADQAVYLDCRSEEIRTLAFPRDLAFVIADSGTRRDLGASEYNARRQECAEAARALQVSSLRLVTAEQLAAAEELLAPVLLRRVNHIAGENDRVWRALECIEMKDAQGIGELMNASHESSRTNFENSTPELDALVAAARSLPGVLGSRLTGGGFGGATVSLVKADRGCAVADELNERFVSTNAFVCRLADGAAVLHGLKTART